MKLGLGTSAHCAAIPSRLLSKGSRSTANVIVVGDQFPPTAE